MRIKNLISKENCFIALGTAMCLWLSKEVLLCLVEKQQSSAGENIQKELNMSIGWFFVSLSLTIGGAGLALYGTLQWLNHANNPKAEAADTVNMFARYAVIGTGMFLGFGISSVMIYLSGKGPELYAYAEFKTNVAQPAMEIIGNFLRGIAAGTR